MTGLRVFVPGAIADPLNGRHGHWHARTASARRWRTAMADRLRAGLKPVRDALRDAGLVEDNGPGAGHVFQYRQAIDRRRRGVEVRAEPLALTARLGQLQRHLEAVAVLPGRCPAYATIFPLTDAMLGAVAYHAASTLARRQAACAGQRARQRLSLAASHDNNPHVRAQLAGVRPRSAAAA